MARLLIVSLTFTVTFFGESESLDDESDESCFMRFWHFLFLLRPLLLNFLYLLSLDESDLLLLLDLMHFLLWDESYSLHYESDDDSSDSGSSGTCSFPLRFENYVGRVSGLGSGVIIPTGFESKCDVFVFVSFISIGVESKGGWLIEKSWCSNSWFSPQTSRSVL